MRAFVSAIKVYMYLCPSKRINGNSLSTLLSILLMLQNFPVTPTSSPSKHVIHVIVSPVSFK